LPALLALLIATQQPPIIVAHRGLAERVPENTLAAFRQSLDRGIKIIELDLRTPGTAGWCAPRPDARPHHRL
jgi:hypothetical protein